MNEPLQRRSNKESLENSRASSKSQLAKPDPAILNRMTALILKYTKDKVGDNPREETEKEVREKEAEAKKQVFEAIRSTVCEEEDNEEREGMEEQAEYPEQQEEQQTFEYEEKEDDQEEQAGMEEEADDEAPRKPRFAKMSRQQGKENSRPKQKVSKTPAARSRSRASTRFTKYSLNEQAKTPERPPQFARKSPPKQTARRDTPFQHPVQGRIRIRIYNDPQVQAELKEKEQAKAKERNQREEIAYEEVESQEELTQLTFKIKIPLMVVKEPKPAQQKFSVMKERLIIPFQSRTVPQRIARPPKKNLAVCSLLQLVKEVYEHELLPTDLVKQFTDKHSNADITDFINKFKSGKLRKFDYASFPFTLLDHRRLAELLVSICPQDYCTEEVERSNGEAGQFLRNIYSLDSKEYYDLYTKIDGTSKILWWSEILVDQETRITKGVKLIETNTPRSNLKNPALRASDGLKKRVKFA